MNPQPAAPQAELRSLALRYARTVDRRDADGFLDIFTPDAVLAIHDPADADPVSVYRGRDDLARIPVRMTSRYLATYHLVGQTEYELDDDGATGEVYCVAHHRMSGPEGLLTYVMYIRYRDRYVVDGERWRIAERRVLVDWTETRG